MQLPFSKELSGLSFPPLLAFSALCALLLFREVAIVSNWEETPVEYLCAEITECMRDSSPVVNLPVLNAPLNRGKEIQTELGHALKFSWCSFC